MQKRLKVLVLAHEFSPAQGSECAVGWNIAKGLSEYHDITVIYAQTNQFNTSNYQESVERYLEASPIVNLRTISIPQPPITRFLARINKFLSFSKSAIGFAPLYFTAYSFWQRRAYSKAKKLIKEERFDLVHQLTAISFRAPGYLYKTDLPLFWGPCSGLVKIPPAFYKTITLKSKAFEIVRNCSNYLQSHLSIPVLNTIKRASAIYPVTNDDYLFFSRRSKGLVRQMLDVGTYSEGLTQIIENSDKVKILWIGRLVYSKAFNLLVDAILINPSHFSNVEFIVIGDGPLFEQHKKVAEQNGLQMIRWVGNLSHHDVIELIKTSDMLVHTSIKEATSAVILEALTYGLPVICHDAFGMGIAINETCGIKVPFVSPEISRDGFYNAILELVNNKGKLTELKKGASIRAKELSWNEKVKVISNDYLKLVNNYGEKL